MKRITIVTSLILSIVFVGPVFASYLGSPLTVANKGEWDIGLETNFITGRDLDISGTTANTLEIEEGNQVGLKASYGVSEGFTAYLKLGMADWASKGNYSLGVEELKYDNDIYYGLGGRYVKKLDNDILLGTDIQYVWQSGVGLDSVKFAGESGYDIKGGDADYSELQITLFFGKEFELSEDFVLVPYLGIGYDAYNYEVNALNYRTTSWIASHSSGDVDGDDEFAFILGTSMLLNNNAKFNLEGRFGAEKAFSLGLSYGF